MRPAHVASVFGLAFGLLLYTDQPRADAPSEAGQGIEIETSGSTRSLKVGEKGRLVLVLRPAARWHVHPQAPLELNIEAAGLELDKTKLGRKDAVKETGEALRFEIPFAGSACGNQEATVHLSLYLCSDELCVKQTRSVTVPVEVVL